MIFSQTMSSGWNRKERHIIKKHNMTRHIKFTSNWIKTTIPLFTFTITKKDTNSISREQLASFYMRTKNKTSTIKNSKERIIRSTPIQFFKKRQTWNMRRWNCINQTYSSKNSFTPKLTKNWSRQRERMNSFNNVPMFCFSNTILLMNICTRNLGNISI